jgi:hypothetical protein
MSHNHLAVVCPWMGVTYTKLNVSLTRCINGHSLLTRTEIFCISRVPVPSTSQEARKAMPNRRRDSSFE